MRNRICDFSSFHEGLYNRLSDLSDQHSLFQNESIQVTVALRKPVDDIQDVLAVTLRAQRLIRIFDAGLENNREFFDALKTLQLPGWESIEGADVAPEMHQNLADKLYNIDSKDDVALFMFGNKSRETAALLITRAAASHIKFNIDILDNDFMKLVFNHCEEEGADHLAAKILEQHLPSTKRIVCSVLMDEELPRVSLEGSGKLHKEIYDSAAKKVKTKSSRGEMLTTLTFLPTRAEAEIDQIPYADYTRLFFEMCDQPWARIGDAQKLLIEQFNRASHVRITNDWGTDIAMELVDEEGQMFTFCNSLIAKNVPGSEIFSAPRRDSVEGRIVSHGRFSQDDANIIENLRLHFTKGCLDLWAAEKGVEHFTKFIEQDEGNHYVGELGIGTNPHLKQHVVNGLLVEKIGGSFHLALGGAYEMTDYMGEPVHVDNGNRSKNHWDITTMLHGAGGCIYLDGRQIMQNGIFIDRRLDVLNRGWEAVPDARKPEYWKTQVTPFQLTY